MIVNRLGYGCVKDGLLCFSFLLFLSGLLIFSAGLWMKVRQHDSVEDYLETTCMSCMLDGPTFYMASGLVFVLLALFSVIVVRDTGRVCAGMLMFLLVLTVLLEISLAWFTVQYYHTLTSLIKSDVASSMVHHRRPGYTRQSLALDTVQQRFQCCGAGNYTDWIDIRWREDQDGDLAVPRSCCKPSYVYFESCGLKANVDASRIFHRGCFAIIRRYVLKNLREIEGFSLWMALVNLSGALLVGYLICFHPSRDASGQIT